MSANYYSNGNFYGEYGKSTRASEAEMEGRFSRSKSAAHLGISLKAFDAGCEHCGYRSTEWHHLGKYATPIDFFDTKELAADFKFWIGAAGAYTRGQTKTICLKRAQRLVCSGLEPEELKKSPTRVPRSVRLEQLRHQHACVPGRIRAIVEHFLQNLPLTEWNWLRAEAEASRLITS